MKKKLFMLLALVMPFALCIALAACNSDKTQNKLESGNIVAEDEKSYVVSVTIPDNASRVLWAGMEFTYKVLDSASSSYITVATGIILSVAD